MSLQLNARNDARNASPKVSHVVRVRVRGMSRGKVLTYAE